MAATSGSTLAQDSPREVDVYESVNRPNLLMGCEREPILVVGMMCAMLIFALLTFWSIVLGTAAWLGAVYALRKMAKVDPIMTRVYSRHLRYAPFYPAQPRVTGREAEVPPGWIK